MAGCFVATAAYGSPMEAQLNTLRRLGSIYQGHPDRRFIPALEASTGSQSPEPNHST